MPLIGVRGHQHYYEWIGDPTEEEKPVMVFLHGWGGSARYWESTARALSPWFRSLLYDLRGFGRSPRSPEALSDYQMESYADDLAALLDVLNLNRVCLQAHSMGASIATLFLNRYPERVERAILTCSGIFEYDERSFTTFHQVASWVVKFRPRWLPYVPLSERFFMARFLHRAIPTAASRAFLEDYLMADSEATVQTIYTSVSQQAAETMPGEFTRLQVPTLLISGEKDIIIPAEMGRRAAILNQSFIKYLVLPKTAHFPMLEDEPTYLLGVREFLGLSDRPLTAPLS